MGHLVDFGLSWLPAVAAALLCVVPAYVCFGLLLLWPMEELPSDAPLIDPELVGKGYPLATPVLAAALVGPDGDLAAVVTAAASVIAGLLAFVVAWEPLIHVAGGHAPVRAAAATFAAIAISVGLMVVLARWLPSWLDPLHVAALVGIPAVVLVAVAVIDDRRSQRAADAPGPSVPEGTYQVKWINLDNGAAYGVEMSDLTISLSPRHWHVEWRGSRWRSQPCSCQVRIGVEPPAFGRELGVVHGPGRYEPGPEGSEIGGIVRGTMGHLLDWRDTHITVVPNAASPVVEWVAGPGTVDTTTSDDSSTRHRRPSAGR